MDRDDEQALIRGMQRGETAACETAIRHHHRFLIAMATPLVGADLAADVAQDTWIKAFVAIVGFEGRSRLRTWLARIALNEAQALLRRRRRELSWNGWEEAPGSPLDGRFDQAGEWALPPRPWHHDTPEALLTGAELHACIRKHLQRLPPAQQAVVSMRELAGLEFAEIAATLELSEGNVRVLLHRARQRLQLMLEHFEEEGTC